MKIKKNAKYAVACVSSMGLRITPEDRMAVHNSNRFMLQATSAETNVLNVTSSLGPECLVLTRFVEGSPMAAFIKSQLRARNIAYVGPDVPQGGPWGYRHQFNIADSGFGLRAPRVWNDRAGEIGRTLDAKDYDTAKLFGKDGNISRKANGKMPVAEDLIVNNVGQVIIDEIHNTVYLFLRALPILG